MSDPSVAAVPPPAPSPPTAPGAQAAISPAEQETADLLYEDLKPQAAALARDFVLARVPVMFQDHLKPKIDADFPPSTEDPITLVVLEQGRVSTQKPAVPG